MDPLAILSKHFTGSERALEIVVEHSLAVAEKALAVGRRMDAQVDLQFLREAAMLHDIGVCGIRAPDIGCTGSYPYITHGIIGREILDMEGFPAHALVCERHIGVGLTRNDIIAQNLPLPPREMAPVTMEERIICFADLFFSKRPGTLRKEKTVDEVKSNLARFGSEKVALFEAWLHEFNVE